MTEEEFQRAQRVLFVLEMTEFKWTVTDVLAQPQDLLDDVIALKGLGNKITIQTRKK